MVGGRGGGYRGGKGERKGGARFYSQGLHGLGSLPLSVHFLPELPAPSKLLTTKEPDLTSIFQEMTQKSSRFYPLKSRNSASDGGGACL